MNEREKFIILDHPSDIGIEAYGNTVEELFLNAAHGMYAILLGDYAATESMSQTFELRGRDWNNLLLQWLTELLFLFETRRFILSTADFQDCTQTSLSGTVKGEEITEEKLCANVGIKAVTYHHLCVEERNGRWFARVFFDV